MMFLLSAFQSSRGLTECFSLKSMYIKDYFNYYITPGSVEIS